MEEPHFGVKLAERMWKIEGLFAEAKQNHCLSRARYRGRLNVQIKEMAAEGCASSWPA